MEWVGKTPFQALKHIWGQVATCSPLPEAGNLVQGPAGAGFWESPPSGMHSPPVARWSLHSTGSGCVTAPWNLAENVHSMRPSCPHPH